MAYALNNAQTSRQPKFSVAIQSDTYKRLINNTLGDPETAKKFVAEITTVVSQNPMLSACDAGSIISAGLLAQTINLSLAPSLGFAYVVPYKDKATFQIGYKGLIQLAIRSGQFERLGVRPVHEGEYAGQDEFGDDKFTFSHEFDANKTVGYYAYFVLVNGFKKSLYMTIEQVLAHAKQYSKKFAKDGKGLWAEQFDLMAEKTVLKLLLNRYAPMSTEMHRAIRADQAVVKGDDNYEYVDNADAKEEPKAEEAEDEKFEPTDQDTAD